MKNIGLKVSYLTGLAFLLTSVLYFFASNWQGIDRLGKIGLSIGLMLLVYGLSFALATMNRKQPFLGKWMLFAGGIVFGISMALLGQIYNSHADSYLLFFVWLIPVALFGLVTRYQPFYVLGFVLLQTGIWFFIEQTRLFRDYDIGGDFLVLFLYALLNSGIFAFAGQKREMRVVAILSFLAAHVLWLTLALNDFQLFPGYGFVSPLLYSGILAGGFYWFVKVREDKVMLTLNGLIAAGFLLIEFFIFSFNYLSDLFYVIGLVFCLGVLVLGGWLVKKLTGYMKQNTSTFLVFVKHLTIVLITLLVSFVGTLSTFGFFFAVMGFEAAGAYLFALLFYVLPGVMVLRKYPTVGYTLATIGFLVMLPAAWFGIYQENYVYTIVVAILLSQLQLKAKTSIEKGYLFAAGNLLIMGVIVDVWDLLVHNWINLAQGVLVTVAVINAGMYFLVRNTPAVRCSAFLYWHASLLMLAIGTSFAGNTTIYYMANALFLASLMFSLYKSQVQPAVFEKRISMVLLALYFVYTYYDFAWTLLHKSVTFFLIGSLLMGLAIYWDRHTPKQTAYPSFLLKKPVPILMIIALQLVIAGVQVVQNETLLKEGKEIVLALEPLDPRSLMQGDYVIINYDISRIPPEEEQEENDSPERLEDGSIDVLLKPGKNGVYEYAGNYKQNGVWKHAYVPAKEDVIIAGTVKWSNQVEYGIEHYFVPEETGRAVEETARFAKVKVGKSGNAMVVELLPEKP